MSLAEFLASKSGPGRKPRCPASQAAAMAFVGEVAADGSGWKGERRKEKMGQQGPGMGVGGCRATLV